MKKHILLSLMLLSIVGYAQRATRKQFNKAQAELNNMKDSDSECGSNKKLSAKQRGSFYPFNISKKVALISFDLYGEYGNQVPIENQLMIKDLIKEKAELSLEKIESLTDLLYNIGYKNPKAKLYSIIKGTCYEPRNAIVFLNQNDKIIEYIGLCFSCGTHAFSSDKIIEFNYCTNKYALLAKFFRANDVKFGTSPNQKP